MIKSIKKNRSGITLLFVISMIVLFLLMGASFVIMSTQFRRSNVERARIQTRRDDARTLVSRAFYDLFRGPSLDNQFSPLRGHSLLADQYGYGVRSTVQTAVALGAAGNQFLVLSLDSDPTTPEHEYIESFAVVPALVEFSRQGGAYSGQVLSFIDGPAAGLSSRIVNYVVSLDGNGNILNRQFVLMPQWDDASLVLGSVGALADSTVLINGRDFSGTGAGFYTPATPEDNAALDNLALFPNRTGEPRNQFLSGYYGTLDAGGAVVTNPLGPNENYDAVDFQNMFLAAIRDEDGDGAIDPLGIIPSFHRPTMIAYHENIPANAGVAPQASTMRVANGFNGGGPLFPAVDAPPEVDNDLDGINDGVWLDIGLPLQTDMKGRVYKPLVSYLVVDMDGKLNVNAHGSQADLDPNTGQQFVTARTAMLDPNAVGGIMARSRGQGMGTAEISLGAMFGLIDYGYLLGGGTTPFTGTALPGRYGADLVPGRLERDMVSINKWYSHPDGTLGGYFGSPFDPMGRFGIGVVDFYSNPLLSDPYDNTSATVNVPIGMPVIDALNSTWSTAGPGAFGADADTELKNSPYEMSFLKKSFMPTASDDAPFSPREMERVLRLYDPDAVMLPARLREFTRNSVDAQISTRMAFTHASFEVPVAPGHLVQRLRDSLIDVSMLPLNAAGQLGNNDELFVNRQVGLMLSPDLQRGLRMDVNRPFGNGNDDDADGITDESWHPDSTGTLDPALNESQAGENLAQADSTTTFATTPFDGDNDGVAANDPDDHLTRQHFARHLYILTLLATERIDRDGDGAITPAGDWYDYDNSGGPADLDDWVAYRVDVAQWAINVVNFRDRDVVRHPFEVDLNPWNGWHVNGILDDDTLAAAPALEYNGQDMEDADKIVVWGVERPEMVMSEVLAMHDRRTEDRDDDDGSGDFTGANGGADPNNDSALVPNASFFLELYNPWIGSDDAIITANNFSPVYPQELYNGNGIDLQRTAPDGSPVWQVMVAHVDPALAGMPANPDAGTLPENQVLRRIYFTKPDATVDPVQFGTNKVYFPSNAISSALPPLAPGTYAVAGSSGVQDGDRYHTYLGRRDTLTWATELEDGSDETRRITLDVNNNEFEINYFDATGSWDVLTREAVVIPIGFQEDGSANGKARSVGVTDPVQGYDVALGAGFTLAPVADGFQILDATATPVIRDLPLDEEFSVVFNGNPEWPALQNDGMHNTDQLLRVVHLRCLANPQAPYDAVTNPYLTVDSLGLPVNAFNGASADPEVGAAAINTAFGSRERGANDADVGRERLFWRADQNGILTPVASAPQTDNHFHGFNLTNSFAELDVAYRNALNIAGAGPSLNSFPWLNWNNRPYISHLELANVPFTSSYWLLSRTDYEPGGAGSFDDYDTFAVATADVNRDVFAGRFKHLPGFHGDLDTSPRLQRVMDFLEVPSRFVGTETYFNPIAMSGDTGYLPSPSLPAGEMLPFNPPFNKISNYRYPGKINLNTIFDTRVWAGLMKFYDLGVNPVGGEMTYVEFVGARQGIGGAAVDYPTEFAAPFRAADSANLVPVVDSGDADLLVAGRTLGGVDALPAETGLFRRTGPGDNEPLFDVQANPGPHADPDRNAYFRYDMRQRLGNLVTTRSSVFSIWITIGFFEVDENLTIGAEVGSDTGEVQRYRGFYMVDRSIPVAFEPGNNHNVDQAVLTSSITERAITRD